MALSPISVNRANTLRGREAIAAFFDQKRNIRLPQGCVLRAAYHVQASQDPGLKFMIVVSKRVAKRAHDRNQLRRWIRAGITQIPAFTEVNEEASAAGMQLILLLSPVAPPSMSVNWESIVKGLKDVAAKTQSSVLTPHHSRTPAT